MQKLKSTNKERVHILHIGDSHVQADIFTHEARTLLGGSFGHAGRGMVFPYTTARTHTAADYRCYHTGKWYYARNVERRPDLPLGVTGV
ncbi:MAG: peptidoglycan-binding protein, partial [Bacteroidia bacterium]